MNCELCTPDEETVLWQNKNCRILLVDDTDYPGFCRVVWNHHIKEMTDLSVEMRNELMKIVFIVESAVRKVMQPDKINLASLGNMTPHLHWHIIPRYSDDKHFPNSIWGPAIRNTRISNQIDIRDRLRSAIQQTIK